VSLTPTTTGGAGTTLFYKLDFGVVRSRRIEVYGGNLAFNGVLIGPTDTIRPARVRGPRTIVLGDSFTAFGCSAVGPGIGLALSDALGWDDVWNSGVGGTGFLATNGGVAPTLRARVQRDVIAHAPEVVLVLGQINDSASSPAAIGAEAALLFGQIRSALPGVLILAAPNFNGGVNKPGFMAQLAIKNAVKAACLAAGGLYLDLLEMPLPSGFTAPSGLSTDSKGVGTPGDAVGGAQVLLNFVPQPGSHVEIGGTERLHVKSFNMVTATKRGIQFDGATRVAHAVNEPARAVGPCFWTGTGRIGAPTGFGNADLLVDTDGVHPTHDLGCRALGYALADLLIEALAPNSARRTLAPGSRQ
jgi:lysophospholipase L1-like esterase